MTKRVKPLLGHKADQDPIATVAEWILQFAFLIYLYTVFGCQIFKISFFRQLVAIFQLIRVFIIFGGLLPCVLHNQAAYLFPNVGDTWGRIVIITLLLLGNIMIALLVKKYLETCKWASNCGILGPLYGCNRRGRRSCSRNQNRSRSRSRSSSRSSGSSD